MNNTLRRRLLSIFLIMAVITTIFSPITAKADTGEDDKDSSYVNINSEADLSKMSNSTSDKYYILTEDIVISEDWKPISDFVGTFDGGGHTITFNIDKSTGAFVRTQYLGLFASCTDATIKNLYVNGNISLTTGGSLSNPNVYIGGVVSSSTNSTLENVHFSGNINVETNNDNSSWAGGLVGKAENTQISLCSNTASITTKVNTAIGISQAGGLCGEFSGTIDNSYNFGNVLVNVATDSPYAGGIVGKNKGSITKSYNAGTVKSQGSGMSLSDVYAGGIAALGETGSSITDCAVMSSEISVVIGWVNTGYKNIIAKGGSKSNNIAINSISGSPSNDANSRYTNAKLKTAEPYSLDFSNTWAIGGTINNGYPYHERNPYATNIKYQDVPSALQSFIDECYISINDVKQTDDGFTLCTKPLAEIFSDMGVSSQINGSNNANLSLIYLTSWYIYSVGNNYSILKMKGYEEARRIAQVEIEEAAKKGEELEGEQGKVRGVGTSIPFMEFDISLINTFKEDLSQGNQSSQAEFDLYTELNKLIYGRVDEMYTYCFPIADYFSKASSKGSHLIAEEYIRKILATERDANGYIQAPDNLKLEQNVFLATLPNIYDSDNNRILINSDNNKILGNSYNLTNDEKKAILACRTGNLSLNAFTAENIAHAAATIKFGDFLQVNDINHQILIIVIEATEPETDDVIYEFTRDKVEGLFESAIKSDTGLGEDPFPLKEVFVGIALNSSLEANFGAV